MNREQRQRIDRARAQHGLPPRKSTLRAILEALAILAGTLFLLWLAISRASAQDLEDPQAEVYLRLRSHAQVPPVFSTDPTLADDVRKWRTFLWDEAGRELEFLASVQDPPAPVLNAPGYHVFGNAWCAEGASPESVARVVERIQVAQEFRDWCADDMIAAGLERLLKYRLGAGAWAPDGGSGNAPERREVWDRASGATGGPDLRMVARETGAPMRHRDGFDLVDVIEPGNAEAFAAILADSLRQRFLAPGYAGAFLDVAGTHNAASYPGQTPARADYSPALEEAGWAKVYGALVREFPDRLFLLNAHRPWNPRTPQDLTGLGLVRASGAQGLMSESRMIAAGLVSGWADETIRDMDALLEDPPPRFVVILNELDRSRADLVEQQTLSLAYFLLAARDPSRAYYGLQGWPSPPDFPENTLDALGVPTGPLEELGPRADVLCRDFERGRVCAHARESGTPVEVDTAGGFRLRILGGGTFPAGQGLEWTRLEPGTVHMVPPARSLGTIPADSALIVRRP